MTDQIKQDINALVEQPRQPRTLPPVEPVGGIPAGRGIAPYRAGGSGGIAGPLTERAGTRLTYPTAVVIPESGFFAYLVQPVRRMTFDSPSGELVVNFALPKYMVIEDEP